MREQERNCGAHALGHYLWEDFRSLDKWGMESLSRRSATCNLIGWGFVGSDQKVESECVYLGKSKVEDENPERDQSFFYGSLV
jgi:hypothetical protein